MTASPVLRQARRAAAARGLTLIELMMTLAVAATLTTLALPSFSAMNARAQLRAAAEQVAGDLGEARLQAAARGQDVQVNFKAGDNWCYVLSTLPACTCSAANDQACALRNVQGQAFTGVRLETEGPFAFSARASAAQAPGAVLLRSQQGDSLRVQVSRLGRARICTPGAGLSGYPRC